MKYFTLLLISSCLLSLTAFNQPTRSIRVKAGDDVAQAYSPQGFYRLPQFSKAILYYSDGKAGTAQQFNFNLLSSNLQFIGPKGDTLDLSGQSKIDSIVFDKLTLLYDDGFMEIVSRADSVMLLKKVVIKTQAENIGAYGQPNNTASILNIKSFQTSNGVFSLILAQDVVVSESTSWFFMDKNRNLVKANKSNLSKVLSSNAQARADAYLKQNKTSFEKEADLKKLMEAIAM